MHATKEKIDLVQSGSAVRAAAAEPRTSADLRRAAQPIAATATRRGTMHHAMPKSRPTPPPRVQPRRQVGAHLAALADVEPAVAQHLPPAVSSKRPQQLVGFERARDGDDDAARRHDAPNSSTAIKSAAPPIPMASSTLVQNPSKAAASSGRSRASATWARGALADERPQPLDRAGRVVEGGEARPARRTARRRSRRCRRRHGERARDRTELGEEGRELREATVHSIPRRAGRRRRRPGAGVHVVPVRFGANLRRSVAAECGGGVDEAVKSAGARTLLDVVCLHVERGIAVPGAVFNATAAGARRRRGRPPSRGSTSRHRVAALSALAPSASQSPRNFPRAMVAAAAAASLRRSGSCCPDGAPVNRRHSGMMKAAAAQRSTACAWARRPTCRRCC